MTEKNVSGILGFTGNINADFCIWHSIKPMWQHLQGHDTIRDRFRQAFRRGRLAGSFLFVGPAGIGKRRFAFALAAALLCKKQDDLTPCGECDSCKLFGTMDCTAVDFDADPFLPPHPDLYYIAKPPDKSFLPMELLVGDKEHRGKAGLCYSISRTPFLGNRKAAIINDADFFNTEGANALLKTLEEPPADAVLILIGTSTAKQLPTIKSRCQIVRFSPLPTDVLSSILVKTGMATSAEQGEKWAMQAEGSLEQAKELADGDIETLRTELLKCLTASRWDAVGLASKLNGLVESLGKEAPPRRRRTRLIFGLAIEHFRSEMRVNTCSDASRRAARRLERTLDAIEHVDRNANLPLVIETWAVAMGG